MLAPTISTRIIFRQRLLISYRVDKYGTNSERQKGIQCQKPFPSWDWTVIRIQILGSAFLMEHSIFSPILRQSSIKGMARSFFLTSSLSENVLKITMQNKKDLIIPLRTILLFIFHKFIHKL